MLGSFLKVFLSEVRRSSPWLFSFVFFFRMRRLPFIILHPHLGAPFLLLEIVLVANIDPKIGGNFPSPELSLTLLCGSSVTPCLRSSRAKHWRRVLRAHSRREARCVATIKAGDKPMLGMFEIYRHAGINPLCVRRQDQAVKPAQRRFGGAFPRGCNTVQMSRLNRP